MILPDAPVEPVSKSIIHTPPPLLSLQLEPAMQRLLPLK